MTHARHPALFVSFSHVEQVVCVAELERHWVSSDVSWALVHLPAWGPNGLPIGLTENPITSQTSHDRLHFAQQSSGGGGSTTLSCPLPSVMMRTSAPPSISARSLPQLSTAKAAATI